MQLTSAIESIYDRPRVRAVMHALFWLIVFGVKLYLTNVSFNVYRGFPLGGLLIGNLFSTMLLAAFYYIFVYAIMPRLLVKRYVQGILATLFLIIFYTSADAFTEIALIHNCKSCVEELYRNHADYAGYLNRGLINVALTRLVSLGTTMYLLLALGVPFSIKLSLQAYRDKLHALQMAKDNLQLEFNFLRAQLNPHFLFNSMNNIYGLILSGDNQRSAELVARLSEVLRYTLYESNEETMPVRRELKLMTDYIELEKIRLNETKVRFDQSADHQDYTIAPLLLMPLIENAFKYSGDKPGAFIAIFSNILNGKLRFTIDNSIDNEREAGVNGGIGINNFKKRMDLYYPNKYEYGAGVSGNIYSVDLSIEL